MRNIWTVFKTDLRTLSKCFFACVVVVAIALLPSLYAWLNIYSNWDPYGNTGGISIAVASLDEGYTDADGTYENKGDDVVADLREATSINWVIVDTEEQAKGWRATTRWAGCLWTAGRRPWTGWSPATTTRRWSSTSSSAGICTGC